MLGFASDYMEGAHDKILQRLIDINYVHNTGYGSDYYCRKAARKIARACGSDDVEVEFLSGGTQTNQVVIDALLQPYQGVVSAATGHVAVHEAGAIEFTGHKVIELPAHDGKIDAEELAKLIDDYWNDESHEHMVMPGMVYISQPTEYGTLYSLSELHAISKVCRANGLPLYMDGARLGYALAAQEEMSLRDIVRETDVFYIGGTKVGALIGEAVVFTHHNRPAHFLSIKKQHGALLAKGWLIGIQFDTLFTDDLYMEISRHAVRMAMKMKDGLERKGYSFYIDSPTNQQFIIIGNERMQELKEKVLFSVWGPYDAGSSIIRLATSWATLEEDVDALIDLM